MNLYLLTQKATILLLTFLVCGITSANPVLNNIGAGQVSISQQHNSTVINQTSSKAIINWRSFNIGGEESTHFQQPAGGVILNRIDATQGVSQIYGKLTSTGRIILVNPAGFYFGPHAYVNIGGLIATTSAMSDTNFLNDRYEFNPSGVNGSIINEGVIVARDNGLVALVAPGVINKGVITANVGKVVLASGEAFTIDFAGDQLINFTITKETTKRGADKDGNELRDGVANSGTVIANGGKILVSAKSARGVLDNVINIDGVMQAKSVSQVNGQIILNGDVKGGIVKVSGKMIATGKSKGQRGGNVVITGHQILLTKNAYIDVSGDSGAGNINIGGSYQGKGPLPNASAVVVETGAELLANAQTHGNGGNIILWADDVTKVYGNLSARGGALDGNGGFIETSAKNYLEVGNILVDTSAPHGKLGTWLLDPRNIDITAATTSGMSTSGGNPNTFSAIADNAQVSAATIITNLATANVIITTGSTGTQDGDINVNAPITWLSANSLTLMANRNINLNAAITNITSSAAILYLIANSAGNFAVGSGQGIVNIPSAGLINLTGTANVYFNPSSYGAALPANYANPSGTFRAFKYINSATDLQTVSNTSSLWSSHFALSKNIDASSLVGYTSIGSSITAYSGIFDGLNHEISNLTVNTVNSSGLFNIVSGSIRNIGLTNLSVTGNMVFVGGLAGQMTGTGSSITNSYVIGTITNPNIATGLLVGGMVGTNSSISNSYSSGTVTGGLNTGGLLGYSNNSVGITVSNSYSTANVTGTDNVGGLEGYLGVGVIVSNSYASGNVNGDAGVGGLVGGSNVGTIINSYALGNVSGTTSQIGGLVGNFPGGTLTTSYSTGAVTGPVGQVGGLIGNRGAVTVTNSYWDTQTSGRANAVATGVSTGITGLTTTQFKTLASFAGFSITSTVSTTSTKPAGTWFIFAGQTRPMLLTEWSTSIANAHQLQLIGSTLGASYTLTQDISLVSGMTNAAEIWGTSGISGAGFAPIGTVANKFTGILEGASHTINGLYINTGAATNHLGLFGYSLGTIRNLALTNINIINGLASFNIGGIAGISSGTISNVSVSGNINPGSTSTDVGGIAGINGSGTITNSSSSVNILSGTGSIGGLVGYNNSSITNSFSTGSVTITGSTGGSGGFSGWNDVGGFISNSYSTGNVVVGNGQQWIGGFVGVNNATIQNSFSSGNVTTGTNSIDVGGFVGVIINGAGNISNSYSTGNVSTGATSTHVGGFIGGNLGIINRSFSLGSVTGVSGTNIGGFVGINQSGSINDSYSMGPVSGGTITNVAGFAAQNLATLNRVYSIGYVNGVNGSVGGLVGANSGVVTNSFWNTETSGRLTSGGGTAKTTAQMFQQGTYTGWTFPATWNIINAQSYPYLTAFYAATPRAISGTSPVAAGGSLTLVSTNTALSGFNDIAYVGANGGYYFLEGTIGLPTIFPVNHSISDNALFLIYANGSNKANTIGRAAASNGSMININMGITNTLKLVGTSSITNTDIGSISTGIAASNLLFSVSVNQLTLGNLSNNTVILSTASNTPYTMDGNTTTFGGGNSSAIFDGSVNINSAAFTTTGSQQYNGAVTLGSDTALSTTNSNIIFASTLNSMTTARSLTLNAGGGLITLATVGNLLPLNILTLNSTSTTTLGGNITAASLTTNAGGNTVIGGTILTTGNQTYNDTTTLAANTIFNGAVLTFTSPITGAFNLAMTGTSIILNGGAVNTSSGTQSYTGPLTFGTDTTFTGSSLTFNNAINTSVNLIFNGTTYLNGSTYNTNANNQTYNGAIVLGANTLLSGNTLTLNGALNGNYNIGLTGTNLILNGGILSTGQGSQTYTGALSIGTNTNFSGGVLTFNNPITTVFNLTMSGSNIVLNGGYYDTDSASQTYSGIISLGADTTLTGATISLTGSLNGNHNFVLNGTNLILNISAINTGNGNQTYNGNLIIGSNLSFTGGVLTFNDPINTNVSLVFTGSNIILNSNSYNTNSGSQSYFGPLTLTADTTLTGSQIMINNGVTGNQQLHLVGNILEVNGNLALTNITATGNASNNIFTLNNSNNETFILNGAYSGTLTVGSLPGTFTNIQTINAGSGNNVLIGLNTPSAWNINSTNGGNIDGSIAFTNIQSLIAGDFDDTFHFGVLSSITNITAGGGSNTLDFRNNGIVPINVILGSNIFQGSVTDWVNQYTGINNLIGNQPTFNLIRLPNKTNSLVVTGPREGYIGDPLTFQYFDNITSTSRHDTIRFTSPPIIVSVADSTAVVGDALMYFPGFNLGSTPDNNGPIPGIIEQGNKPQTGRPVVIGNNDINLNSILDEMTREFEVYWESLKINPECGLASSSKDHKKKCKIANQLVIESSLR